jgi:nucleoside-diphosphate-sugar epimerase
MFGKVQAVPQTEVTPFWPRSPYGCAKVYAYWADRQLPRKLQCTRATASSSTTSRRAAARRSSRARSRAPRRASRSACRKDLYLGNLDAQRDWGYAKEYVEMMWLMLQQEKPDDYVVATNETHSVKEFCQVAFAHLGLDWEKYVKYDALRAPAEVELLIGDPAKATRQLGWAPKVKLQGARQDHGRPRPGPRQARVPDREAAEAVTKLFIAGHQGMVGSALVRRFKGARRGAPPAGQEAAGPDRPRRGGGFLAAEKPDVAIIAAAKVGGIHANSTYPASSSRTTWTSPPARSRGPGRRA